MSYEKIKEYYDNDRWTKTMVRKAVEQSIITKEQYKKITGEEY